MCWVLVRAGGCIVFSFYDFIVITRYLGLVFCVFWRRVWLVGFGCFGLGGFGWWASVICVGFLMSVAVVVGWFVLLFWVLGFCVWVFCGFDLVELGGFVLLSWGFLRWVGLV